MNTPMTRQPTLGFGSDPFHTDRAAFECLLVFGPDLLGFLGSSARPADVLKSLFRVTVAQASSPEGASLPDVSGRYQLFEDEVRFAPHFPFE